MLQQHLHASLPAACQHTWKACTHDLGHIWSHLRKKAEVIGRFNGACNFWILCESGQGLLTPAGDKFALLDEDEEQLTHLGRSLADDDFKAVCLSHRTHWQSA